MISNVLSDNITNFGIFLVKNIGGKERSFFSSSKEVILKRRYRQRLTFWKERTTLGDDLYKKMFKIFLLFSKSSNLQYTFDLLSVCNLLFCTFDQTVFCS
jgi:hypothetical protein